MPEIELGLEEAYYGQLPKVCICCGAPAVTLKTKMFSLSPFGIPFFVLPGHVVLPGRIWLRAPFCGVHRHYWLKRTFMISASLVALLTLGFVGFVLLVDERIRASSFLSGLLCTGTLVGLFAWAVAVVTAQRLGIRLAKHTDRTLTLRGVAEEFVQAVQVQRARRSQS